MAFQQRASVVRPLPDRVERVAAAEQRGNQTGQQEGQVVALAVA